MAPRLNSALLAVIAVALVVIAVDALRRPHLTAEDIANARKKGCNPGGNIVIHGLENGYDWVGRTHCSVDWTSGCVAITNQEMDRLWQIIPVGTPVEIRS